MKESFQPSLIMTATGGWCMGFGTSIITENIREEAATSPYLGGLTLMIVGIIMIVTEIYMSKQKIKIEQEGVETE